MQAKIDIPSVQVPVLLYCAWNARDLLGAWQHCLYDRHAWMVLLIWSLPVVMARLNPDRRTASGKTQAIYTAAGLLCSFTGGIGSLNLLQYAGLALALACWIPFSRMQLLWLLSSLSWMPALGWIGSRFFLDHVLVVRLMLSVMTSGLLIYHTATRKRYPGCMATTK